MSLLLEGEQLGRTALGRAVDPHARPDAAPGLSPALGVGQVDELLAGEERVAHEGHDALDPGLVGGLSHPGRVDEEATVLGVLDEGLVEAGLEVVGLIDDARHVVGDDDLEDPAEEGPGRLEAGDDNLCRLGEAEPHEASASSSRP